MPQSKTADSSASVAVLSVFAEIDQRLAGFTAGDYIAPSVSVEDEEGVMVVGTANDHLRRLYTLMVQTIQEVKSAKRVLDEIGDKIQAAATRQRNFLDMIRGIRGGEVTEDDVAQYEAAETDLRLKSDFATIVKKAFWLDLRRIHPELQGKAGIGIYSDWSIGWQEKPETEIEGFIIMGSGVGMDMGSALKAMRRHMREDA